MTAPVAVPTASAGHDEWPEPQPARFSRAGAPGAELAYECFGHGSLAVLNPLSYGITLRGLQDAPGRRSFLTALGAGYRLVCFDQRGSGDSSDLPVSGSWDERAADVWALADALGIERAVLYGVFDAGHTVIRAALQEPERALGVILNFVPQRFSGGAGNLSQWFPDDASGTHDRTLSLLLALGVDAGDAGALADHWAATVSPEGTIALRRMVREASLEGLASVTALSLLLEPKRPLFKGWAEAMQPFAPRAVALQTKGTIQALGAMHAHLGRIVAEEGQGASLVSPLLASEATDSDSELARHRRILVSVSDTPGSARTVALACRLGEIQKASITLASVMVLPFSVPVGEPPADLVSAAERPLRLGEAIVRRSGLPVESRLLPARRLSTALMSLAAESGASLVVLGDRGLEDDTELADAAHDLISKAHCEVLVDRGGDPAHG